MSRKLRFFLFPLLFNPLCIKKYCIYGTKSTATNKEIPNIIVIAHGNDCRKSLYIPFVVMRKGKNVILMAKVADKIDLKNSLALVMAEYHRENPWSNFSI